MKFRSAYSAPVRVSISTVGPSRSKQSMAAECDLNQIMAKAQRGMAVDHFSRIQGRYGDFVGPEDYHQAINMVMAADEMFMSLPAMVRKRFDNDPAYFLAFAQDPKNQTELISMGLAKALEGSPDPDRKSQGDGEPGVVDASEASSEAE